MAKNIVIFMDGGLIQGIWADDAIEIRIIDWDRGEEEDYDPDRGSSQPDLIISERVALNAKVGEVLEQERGRYGE